MKIRLITLIVWGSVLAALGAWMAVVMFLMVMWTQKDARLTQITDAEETAARESASIRLHALARDTQNLREQLDGLAQVDALEVANMIEGVGKLAGVKVKIGNVLAESAKQGSTLTTPTLREINFFVETEGSFAALMHATALFETLPVPSVIKSTEFKRALSSASKSQSQVGAWNATTHILVLSASDASL